MKIDDDSFNLIMENIYDFSKKKHRLSKEEIYRHKRSMRNYCESKTMTPTSYHTCILNSLKVVKTYLIKGKSQCRDSRHQKKCLIKYSILIKEVDRQMDKEYGMLVRDKQRLAKKNRR